MKVCLKSSLNVMFKVKNSMLFFFNQNKSVDFLNNSTKYIVYRQHLALDYVQSLLKSKEIVRKPNAEFVLFRKL